MGALRSALFVSSSDVFSRRGKFRCSTDEIEEVVWIQAQACYALYTFRKNVRNAVIIYRRQAGLDVSWTLIEMLLPAQRRGASVKGSI